MPLLKPKEGRDKEVMLFIEKYFMINQRSPSYKDIHESLQIPLDSAFRAVKRLIRDGYLTQQKGKGRSLRLTSKRMQ